jgi:ribonuclease Z
MRITLLGTGTPTPSLTRMCSGYVVEIGEDLMQVSVSAPRPAKLL